VLHPSRGPKRLLGDSGRVTAIETLKVDSVFDEEGNFNPTFVEGSEQVLRADTVILAIGQTSDREALKFDPIKWTEWGTVDVDPDTLATSMPGVYAGGDLAFGPRIVIDAVQDGRVAARSIDELLRGSRPRSRSYSFTRWMRERPLENFDQLYRTEPPTLPTDRRVGFKEVELGYDEEQARTEARRCLACHVNTVFDSAKCIMCGGCVDVCPEYCLKIVPTSHLADNTALDGLKKTLDLPDDGSYAMIKNEDLCIRCSLCARRCPTGAITMEFFRWEGNWR
jgi:NADPH-dependent glutamate synthase beta subunit-like oxidoreductase